jgi:hypothetical protein
MKFGNLLFGVLAVSMCAGNAAAANKTRLMDMQGSGNSRFDVYLGMSQWSGQQKFPLLGTTVTSDFKSSTTSLTLDYIYGVTERLDISLVLPLLANSKSTSEYNYAGNHYKSTSQDEGVGDAALAVLYRLMDKQTNGLSWNVTGYISPSTASSTAGTSEQSVNGVVTVAGTKGNSGRGYTQTGIGTAVGMPTSIGDVVFDVKIYSGGEKTDAGIKTTYGSSKYFNIYLEAPLNASTTLAPYVGYFSTGTSTTAGTAYPSANYYSAGLMATVDVSNKVSLRGTLEYSKMKQYTAAYSGGSAVSNQSGYTASLVSMFFF